MEEQKKSSQLDTPRAIIIAGIIIAVAILITQVNVGNRVPQINTRNANTGPSEEARLALLEKVNPVTSEDHVRGTLDAEITIIEYSDFECPFCKQFHNTMIDTMSAYDGKVAWVYRHYPLDSLHPIKARKAAIASECIAKQKGEKGFWFFTDAYFERTLTNNRTDTDSLIAQIATEFGADMTAFEACVTNEETREKVNRDLENAEETGGNGTPWSIIVTKDGKKYPIGGALPYEMLKQQIDEILRR